MTGTRSAPFSAVFRLFSMWHLSSVDGPQRLQPEASNSRPEFCSERGPFALCFLGNRDHKKNSKNLRHFSMPNPQQQGKNCKSLNFLRVERQSGRHFKRQFGARIFASRKGVRGTSRKLGGGFEGRLPEAALNFLEVVSV